MNYDYGVYIGRFQPLHDGHVETLNVALSKCKKVIVLVGSANAPRSIKNPFTYAERAAMIRGMYGDEVTVQPLNDYTYDEKRWVRQVKSIVAKTVLPSATMLQSLHGFKGAIIGHEKDESSFYLKLFPEWDLIDAPKFPGHTGITIDATKLREMLLIAGRDGLPFVKGVVPLRVLSYLDHAISTQEWGDLTLEYRAIAKYRNQWAAAPYPPTFMAADAIVIGGGDKGGILVVKRNGYPGKGLLAMPGGFMDVKEKWDKTAPRECLEETGVDVSSARVERTDIYDSPNRDTRGRTVTMVTVYRLDPFLDAPTATPSDDAADAFWMPYRQLLDSAHLFYSDHWHIITSMLGGHRESDS